MATPLEMNTTELEGLLQDVYNLPDRNSGGSSEPDLVITPGDDFAFNKSSQNQTYNVSKISFDPSEVVSTYEKLIAGKDVRVVFTGRIFLNSWSPRIMTTYPAMRVLAYDTDVTDSAPSLVVKFMAADVYWFMSNETHFVNLEYRFQINPATGDVTFAVATVHG